MSVDTIKTKAYAAYRAEAEFVKNSPAFASSGARRGSCLCCKTRSTSHKRGDQFRAARKAHPRNA